MRSFIDILIQIKNVILWAIHFSFILHSYKMPECWLAVIFVLEQGLLKRIRWSKTIHLFTCKSQKLNILDDHHYFATLTFWPIKFRHGYMCIIEFIRRKKACLWMRYWSCAADFGLQLRFRFVININTCTFWGF